MGINVNKTVKTSEQAHKEAVELNDLEEKLLSIDDLTDFSEVFKDMDAVMMDLQNNILL